MRKLNVKLSLILLAAVAAAGGGVWALHAFQYQRIAAALLWQARRAEQDQKFDQMVRYLQRYLEFAPHDVEQAAHLGATLAGEHFADSPAARRQAYYVLNNVVNEKPERLDLQRLLVKTALEVGEWSTARSALEALAKNPDAGAANSPERGELEGYWGRLLAAEKKPDEAIEHSRLAVRQAPADEDSYVRLAWLLRARKDAPARQREKDVAEADQVINDLVANNPGSAKAHLARWRYRREFDLLDLRDEPAAPKIAVEKAAAEDVDAALSRAPEDVDALVAKADAQVLLRRPDQAYESLQQGLKLLAAGGGRGASGGGEFELLWHLSTLLLSDPKLTENSEKTAEVEQTIARLRKTRGQPAAADYLQARLLIHKKEWAKAAALLERTRPALAAQQAHADLIGQIDLGLGQCYLALEEPAQAERAFRLVLGWDANRAEARAGLAEAQRALGRVDEALDNYHKAAEGGADPGKNWLQAARLEILRQLQQDDARRDWTKAREAIDRAAHEIPADDPGSSEPTLLRAQILAAQAQWGEAEKLLTDARDAHRDRVEFWTALADLIGQHGDAQRALKVLDEAEAALHDRAELRVCRANRLAAAPKPDLDALEGLVKKDRGGFGGDDLDKLLSGLAEAEARVGRADEAGELLEELAAAPGRRGDLRLRLVLFDVAVRKHDADAMEKSLKAIHEVEGGDGAYYNLGLAVRDISLARAGKAGRKEAFDDAWGALARAAALRPDWSAVELARADVDDLSDDPEGAIKHLKEAVRVDQGRVGPDVIQRLVEALYGRGRYAEAAGYVALLRQSLLVNSPLGRLAAGAALNSGDVERAKQLMDLAVRPGTKDFRDLFLQARVHEAMNQLKEAEAEYRQAAEAAPEEPAAWVAYVQFLGNHDRQTVAQALIKSDVAVKVPKDRAELAMAQCYEALSMTREAYEHYEAALKAASDDPAVVRAVAGFNLRVGRVPEARALLESLCDGGLKRASDADVDWARRALATVLASSTDYNDFRRALELVGLSLDAAGVLPPPADGGREEGSDLRRARARVLATQPQRQFRARAIQLLEGLQPPDNDDLFILAVLYEADGSPDKEVEVLKRLTALDDKKVKPGYLTQYVQLLMRQGQSDKGRLADAERLVERLERLETDQQAPKGAYGTVELRARLLEQQGAGDKALELLRAYAGRRDGRPDDQLLVMAALGRQKHFAEAFDLCEKEDLFHKCPAPAVSGVCEALLRAMPTADGQRDRVEKWLNKAIADHPKLAVLRLHLADLYDLRGDYPKSEALYREMLKDDPGNVVALNNLAWLLAQQTGQGQEALKCIEAAVSGMGRRADLLDTRGMVRLTLGQTDAALADFTEASADTPTAARLFHLARAQLQARDRDAALKTLHRAKADFGLEPSSVHPTEQQVCQTLLNELKVR